MHFRLCLQSFDASSSKGMAGHKRSTAWSWNHCSLGPNDSAFPWNLTFGCLGLGNGAGTGAVGWAWWQWCGVSSGLQGWVLGLDVSTAWQSPCPCGPWHETRGCICCRTLDFWHSGCRWPRSSHCDVRSAVSGSSPEQMNLHTPGTCSHVRVERYRLRSAGIGLEHTQGQDLCYLGLY